MSRTAAALLIAALATGQLHAQAKDAPSHEADETFDWGDRRNEERLRQFQRQPGYWA